MMVSEKEHEWSLQPTIPGAIKGSYHVLFFAKRLAPLTLEQSPGRGAYIHNNGSMWDFDLLIFGDN